MKILLVTPPMSDLNTPYPATAYLTGFLRASGVQASQADWSLELACRLFSKEGLERLRTAKSKRGRTHFEHFCSSFDHYHETIEPVVAFLQGRNPGLDARIVSRGFLPEGSRLRKYLDGDDDASDRSPRPARLGQDDHAGYLATLYLSDLADAVADLEPGFRLISYAKEVAVQYRFDKALRFLRKQDGGLIGQFIEEITAEGLERWRPDVLAVTVPFAGNLVGALRIAQVTRRLAPHVKIVMGGGYPNCYLRKLTDPRLFDFVDFLTLDDGETPLSYVLQHIAGERGADRLLRTFMRQNESVVYCSSPDERDMPFVEAATPSYAELPVERYMAVRFDATRAQRIWSQRWNKLTLAHGCYWRKCTFCDISLDYVQRYEPQRVDRLIGQIETLVKETGHTGFHWVDEAAPPSLLRALSQRLLERKIEISWYGNIRFERAFTSELARLMAESGCVMVTGGLEVASDRLLKRINKGVTVAQVARVAKAFADHGIHVHAYLMYGYPSETVQETVDSLELVRQLFVEGCLHSGHWHRFMVTEHSPIGSNPMEFGVRLRRPRWHRADRVFGRYIIPFKDSTRVDHDLLGPGLQHGLVNFQRGLKLDRPVHEWFPLPVPKTTVAADTIARALLDRTSEPSEAASRSR